MLIDADEDTRLDAFHFLINDWADRRMALQGPDTAHAAVPRDRRGHGGSPPTPVAVLLKEIKIY